MKERPDQPRLIAKRFLAIAIGEKSPPPLRPVASALAGLSETGYYVVDEAGAHKVGSDGLTLAAERNAPGMAMARVLESAQDFSAPGAGIVFHPTRTAPVQRARLLLRDASGRWFVSRRETFDATMPPGIRHAYPLQAFDFYPAEDLGKEEQPDIGAVDAIGIVISTVEGEGELAARAIDYDLKPALVPHPGNYFSHGIDTPHALWGISQLAGATVTYFAIKGRANTGNLVATGGGREFQSAIRSALHGNRYNPTAAGWVEDYTTPTTARCSPSSAGRGDRVEFGPYRMASWTDGMPYGCHELLDETNPETRGYWADPNNALCEFTRAGYYEDVSALLPASVSAIRLHEEYNYVDPPDLIARYGRPGNRLPPTRIRPEGISSYDAAFNSDMRQFEDLSPSLPGVQKMDPSGTMAGLTYVWSWRINQNILDLRNVWWRGGDVWRTQRTAADLARETGAVRLVSLAATEHPLILNVESGDRGDAARALAVGFYYPAASEVNRYPFVGVDRTSGEIVYRDDSRRARLDASVPGGVATFSNHTRYPDQPDGRPLEGDSSFTNFVKTGIRFYYTGMMPPDSVRPGAFERLRLEAVMLVGTPDAILEAVNILDTQVFNVPGHEGGR